MDFMKLKASLSLDDAEYNSGLDKAEGKAKGLGKGIKGAMAAGVAAIGAATTAVGVLVKKSVSAYAEYEQLEGGIKKLYGEATSDMLNYAQQAYITAGMSANSYIQNVTGFSAALLNSVEGDSKEAAKIADMAMQDIADNANTFGKYTAEELAQVYQALAKGQYMTLDNLMLGYGGSKQGMQQLIDHANELAKAQGMAGDLQIDSYADIVQAIHLVQEELNIYGTTANEAAGTIQGSLAMTKAAWENLLTGFASPDADISQLVTNVMTSAGQAASNLVPAIMQAINGISQGLGIIIPQILSKIPEMLQNMAAPLVKTGAEMVASIAKGLMDAIPQVVTVITDLVGSLTESMDGALPGLIENGLAWLENFTEMIVENAGLLVDAGMELLLHLAQGIANAMPAIVEKLPVIISNIANVINNNAPKLLATGVKIIATLGMGLIQAIPTIVANIPQIIAAIWNVFTAFNWLALGKQIITGIAKGIKAVSKNLPAALKRAGNSAKNSLKGINWAEVGKSILSKIAAAAKAAGTMLKAAMKALGRQAKNAFKNIDWKSLGKSIVQGMIRGVTGMVGAFGRAIKRLVKSGLKDGKQAAEVNSPSKLFARELGMPVGEGMALGVEKSTPMAIRAVEDMVNDMAAVEPLSMSVPDSFVNGTSLVQEEMAIEFSNQIAELGEYLRAGMVDAVEGITITLDKRAFGKATRKAVGAV